MKVIHINLRNRPTVLGLLSGKNLDKWNADESGEYHLHPVRSAVERPYRKAPKYQLCYQCGSLSSPSVDWARPFDATNRG